MRTKNQGASALFSFFFFIYHLIQCLGYWLVLFYIFLVMPYTLQSGIDVGAELVGTDVDSAAVHHPPPKPVSKLTSFSQKMTHFFAKLLHFFKGNIPFTIFTLGLVIGCVFAFYNCWRYRKEQASAIRACADMAVLLRRGKQLREKKKLIVAHLSEVVDIALKRQCRSKLKGLRLRRCHRQPSGILRKVWHFFHQHFIAGITHFCLGAGAGGGIMWTLVSLFDIEVTQFVFMAVVMVTAGVGLLYLGLSIYIERNKSALKEDREEVTHLRLYNQKAEDSISSVHLLCRLHRETHIQDVRQSPSSEETHINALIELTRSVE